MDNLKDKKILVLGNVNSIHLKGLIDRVIIPLGFKVEAFCNANYSKDLAEQKEYLYEKGIRSFDKNRANREEFFRFLKNSFHLSKVASNIKGLVEKVYVSLVKLTNSYDIIHVNYVDIWALKLATRLKKKNTKLIATYWGSDLMRVSDEELKKRWKYLKQFDLISTDSIDLENRFKEIYGDDTKFKNAMPRICFGSEIAENIDELLEKGYRQIMRKEIPDDKLVISIGYNAGKAQQHIKVLEALSKLSVEFKKKILIILQMTYQQPLDNYVQEVLEYSEKAGFETWQYTGYLSVNEVAQIRVATDIFINAQTTDAFCSTIKEYMYAGTTLVNAKWLEYKEMVEWGLKSSSFDEFGEIPEIIEKYKRENNDSIVNRNIIRDKFSWDACRIEWEKVYQSLLGEAYVR